jgi:hypothetical protein
MIRTALCSLAAVAMLLIVPQGVPLAEAAGNKVKSSQVGAPYVGRFGIKTLDISDPYRKGGGKKRAK